VPESRSLVELQTAKLLRPTARASTTAGAQGSQRKRQEQLERKAARRDEALYQGVAYLALGGREEECASVRRETRFADRMIGKLASNERSGGCWLYGGYP
jgi:hypothetical protein